LSIPGSGTYFWGNTPVFANKHTVINSNFIVFIYFTFRQCKIIIGTFYFVDQKKDITFAKNTNFYIGGMDILAIQQDFKRIEPFLDEKTTRLYIANKALGLGRCGKTVVSQALGVSRARINNGIKELEGTATSVASSGKQRRSGGGRKSMDTHYPHLFEDLEQIISPYTRGDPMNPLRWCSKSLRKIAKAMQAKGYKISHSSIEKYLQNNNYSLQSNRKTDEGSSDEERDKQFEYINEKAKLFMSEKEPVISVDCKKKELIGNYKNAGREWETSKHPKEVKVYDFIDKELGKAIPYALDIAQNKGWVNVGVSSDTAEFAVNTIRTWWQQMGKDTYPHATKLMITADSGGSNSAVGKLWKLELQRFANETGLEINVCHYPAGTSKWNKIEHRLFSFITKKWRGKPLLSLEIIVNLIANTTTEKGLEVRAGKDERIYQKGIQVTKEEMDSINLKRDAFKGKSNYVISKQM
jgi:hypothetical protein